MSYRIVCGPYRANMTYASSTSNSENVHTRPAFNVSTVGYWPCGFNVAATYRKSSSILLRHRSSQSLVITKAVPDFTPQPCCLQQIQVGCQAR